MIPLFDLDSTLLKGGNTAHADAFAWAFSTVYGFKASPREISTEGMTDNEIILRILKLHGVEFENAKVLLPKAAAAMEKYFFKHEEEGIYIPLPGAVETLTLFREKGIQVGLLTGNVEGIAWRKCEKAGIRSFLAFGAFGNEALRRSELVPIAKRRAPVRDPEEEFIIIGDSPRDIACAQEAGLRSIGVASGKYSVAHLQGAGVSAAIESLNDIFHAFRLLGVHLE